MRAQSPGRLLQSTTTSLNIVDILLELEGARVTEVASALDISKSSACNHLHTLQHAGFVVQDGDEYHPSLKFAYIGERAKRRDAAYEVAVTVTEQLSMETPFETSFIIEENGLGRHLTSEVNQPGTYDRFAFTGQQEYLHTIAAGKSILAALPQQSVERIIDRWGLPAKTDRTITKRDDLFEELADVRERGYAINRGENKDGIYVIAQSVRKLNGTVLGAISVGSPAYRIKETEFTARVNKLLDSYVTELEDRLDTLSTCSGNQ